jgi:predicted phosphohydrolase
MKIFCLSDPHLGLGIGKTMDRFGCIWKNHAEKIRQNWLDCVRDEDLVIVPGDISWAGNEETVKADMAFLGKLPGKIILGKGNHEHWWQSHSKASRLIPENATLLDASHPYRSGKVGIAGTRLWDNPSLSFSSWIDFNPGTDAKDLTLENPEQSEKIFQRELQRLERSLASLKGAELRIAALHYPPLTPDFIANEVTVLLEKHQVQHCVFGHLHSLKKGTSLSGLFNEVHYHLCSVDHIDFTPKLIVEI